MSKVSEPCNRMAVVRSRLDLGLEELIKRIGNNPVPALLTGADGFGDSGRFAILTAEPRLIFESTGGRSRLIEVTAAPRLSVNHSRLGRSITLPSFSIDSSSRRPSDRLDRDVPTFQGGLIGCVGYDLAPLLEKLPRRLPVESRVPDLWFGLYDTFVVYDRAHDHAELWSVDLLSEGERAVEIRQRKWRRRFVGTSCEPNLGVRKPAKLTSNLTRSEYVERVRRVLEYLKAGDAFQVNLAQRFEAKGGFSGFDIFRRLRALNPAPYSAYLRGGAWEVASASPELFYQTNGDRIVTRPIKGTRPRGETRATDRRLAEELASSPKDRAELTMIVDLERNDLGRVCEFGSVGVVDPGSVESFAQVHHLRRRRSKAGLAENVGPIDVSRAMFPGGSITGRPQDPRHGDHRRARTQPPRTLHRRDRLLRAAAGTSDFNIAIRTILVEATAPASGRRRHRRRFRPRGRVRRDAAQRQSAAQAIIESGTLAMIWTNGAIVPDESFAISISDRILEHGIGLFETFRTHSHHAPLLNRHLDRLTRSARDLGIPFDASSLPNDQSIRELMDASGIDHDARIRITLSGGSTECRIPAKLWMRACPLELEPDKTYSIVLANQTLDRNDALARYKSVNYWWRSLRSRAREKHRGR